MERWQPQHGRWGRGRGRGRGNHSSSSFARSNDSRPSTTSNYATTTSKTSSFGINDKQDNNDSESLPNLIGTCPFMCPVDERVQRERLRDLAIFERLEGNPTKSSSSLAVKKFCRTISTKDIRDVDMRPVPVLEDTLNYLLTIFKSRSHPFEVIHDFIFDRTRSIRQDLSMQSITSGDQSIRMFERIVEFHIVSHYKLRRNTTDSNVSPMHYLNLEQLTKALASLYHLYDENRKSNPSYANEAKFYSFFVLLHLGSDHQPTGESLSLWFRSLPYSIVKSKEMMFSRRLLRYFRFGNYKRFLHTTEAEASCLQYYIIEPYISEIRATGLSCLNYGGYKLHPYPLADLSKHLLLEESDVESFCKDCGLDTFTSDTGTKFMPTKQTSFCHPKGSRKYYPLVSERLKPFYDEAPYRI
ncbi:SAC3 family protein C [Cynara cardunculus var. scolymus]|uniref:SAC3/GANP/Nin1/mts3/eIF-3 p25 n=1 Tax=Cynara cardunculus var. scolymus TaxID=59895 RepID=A0A103XWK1_CYNCS|nr:SAC3 family protein C [Cynara cardunculus var. scolymus]KVH98188.1 SAC3/GANP/Nin1/mts3/eIF-3 p25 [Cynara cardunculus var. scolymus]